MEKTDEHPIDQLRLFRVLMDSIPGPVYYKDADGRYLGYNRAFQDYFHLQNADYVGKTVWDLPMLREEAMAHNDADVELFNTPGSRIYRSSVTYPDKSVRHFISKKATFFRTDGTVGGIMGVLTDITELKRAEAALRESEARFRDLSEASLEAVIFLEDGVVVDANRRTYEMFGYGSHEIIGREVLDFIPPHMREEVRERIASRNMEKYETLGLRKDGFVFPLEVHPRELHAKGKQIRISIVRDLTERKSMEEEILKAKNLQSVGTLAGGIAHDFNNLLMAIVGNISLARMGVTNDPKITAFLDEAERIAFMGKSLTHQLLTFSRGGDPIRRIVFLGDIIPDLTERVLGGSMIRAKYAISENLHPIEVDEEQIKQVLHNMILNAKEAMPGGGTILVSCENVRATPQDRLPLIKEDYVCISIRDEGMGIPDEVLTKIFDPYFTTKGMGAQKGVGLGLAICYSIIKKHNGHILVDSVPHRGTTFHIYLPAYKRETSMFRGEDGQALSGRKGRILVMDDEEMILKIAKELLQHLGYDVTPAQNGEEAIGFYRQAMELKKTFDAVILDLAIPGGLGGKEVIQELAAMDPGVKAIISSGYLNDPIIQDYRAYGFSGILTKPYDAKELDDKLQNIMKEQQ